MTRWKVTVPGVAKFLCSNSAKVESEAAGRSLNFGGVLAASPRPWPPSSGDPPPPNPESGVLELLTLNVCFLELVETCETIEYSSTKMGFGRMNVKYPAYFNLYCVAGGSEFLEIFRCVSGI